MVMMWPQDLPVVGLRGNLKAIQMCSQVCDFVSGWIFRARLGESFYYRNQVAGLISGMENVVDILRERQRFGMCVFVYTRMYVYIYRHMFLICHSCFLALTQFYRNQNSGQDCLRRLTGERRGLKAQPQRHQHLGGKQKEHDLEKESETDYQERKEKIQEGLKRKGVNIIKCHQKTK